jgi:hypothetical protein
MMVAYEWSRAVRTATTVERGEGDSEEGFECYDMALWITPIL